MVLWLSMVLGLAAASLVVAVFSWVMIEWIWTPWRLIVSCRKQGISGFPFIPFAGQLPQIAKALTACENDSGYGWEALRNAQKCVEAHENPFYFVAGKTVRICIADPDLVKDVLANNADSYAKPSFIHALDILGDGLFASSGQVWARQRQLLALSFANKHIKTEVGVITSCAHSAVEKWFLESSTKSGEVEVYKKLLALTLDVIKKIAFGADLGSDEKASPLIAGAFDRYLHNCRDIVFGLPAAIPGYRFLPTTRNREISFDGQWLSSVVEELIQARSRAYASSTAQMDPKNVLDTLIKAVQEDGSQRISSRQLRDNCLTILLAGHHTTASLLTWTLYMLSLQPLWQERARAEVEEFCSDGVVEWATLSHLKTITMILQETLRLFPPIPLIGRFCLKENRVGRFMIPAGVEIIIPTAVIHRNKALWGDDADKFVPMRFANGIGKACEHNLGYLPFGHGPRTCIGQTLALAEARIVLAAILPLVSWRLSPGYRHSPDISLTLHPKFDMPIIIEKLC